MSTDLASVRTRVNGCDETAVVQPRMLLSDFLRHELGLTGVHVGCEHGVCGACTVLLDGIPVRACLLFAVQIGNAEVTTIEGLAKGSELHPVQEAFRRNHGLQCGFCTPGMVLSALKLLEENPDPTEDEIRHAIAGNLCRCTGYQLVIKSVVEAARARQGAPAAA